MWYHVMLRCWSNLPPKPLFNFGNTNYDKNQTQARKRMIRQLLAVHWSSECTTNMTISYKLWIAHGMTNHYDFNQNDFQYLPPSLQAYELQHKSNANTQARKHAIHQLLALTLQPKCTTNMNMSYVLKTANYITTY